MKLDKKQLEEIESRERLIRMWPFAGWVMIVLLLGTGLWLFFFNPLLANPVHVMSSLENGTLQASTLVVMAAILPFTTLTALGICLGLVVFAFVSIRREKKYIELINKLRKSMSAELKEDG